MTYRSKRLELFSGKGSSSRRAIYKGCGYDDDDLSRPLIGIVNTANDAGLGHAHLDRLAKRVRAGILQAGGTPFEFGTIATCGAVPIGMPHFRFELVIRDVIASSVEIMTGVQLLDGLVLLASCDSIIPGVLIGAIRADVPAIIITGGSQEVCKINGRNTVMSELDQLVFGADYASEEAREKIRYLEDHVCPGPGACSLMGTANTMQILMEGARHGAARLVHCARRLRGEGALRDADGAAHSRARKAEYKAARHFDARGAAQRRHPHARDSGLDERRAASSELCARGSASS